MARQTHLARRFFGALWPGKPDADRRRVGRDRAQRAGARRSGSACRTTTAATRSTSRATSRRMLAEHRRTRAIRAGPRPRCCTTSASSTAASACSGACCATLAGAAAGHDMAEAWSEKRGVTRQFGLYLRHPELGAQPHPDVRRQPRGRAVGRGAPGPRPLADHRPARASSSRRSPPPTTTEPHGRCLTCGW